MLRWLSNASCVPRLRRHCRPVNVKILVVTTGLLMGFTTQEAIAAPVFGVSPRTQFFLGTAVRSFGLFSRSSDSSLTLETWAIPVVLSYALQTDMTLTVNVPYVRKRLDRPDGDQETDGVGDVNVSWKYTFFRQDRPFGRTQAAFLLGLELPTGEFNQDLPPPLRLGSRSLDGIIGLAAGHTTPHFSIEGGVVYKANAEANDFRFGNVLSYDLYLAYQSYPDFPTPGLSQLNFSVELNGRWAEQNEAFGMDIPTTGGTVVFISPGLQYIVAPTLLFEAGVQVPIVRDLPSGALEPDYNVLFGFRWIFAGV